ncbi:MAG: hypothetical protein ABW176_02410 [Candidatus Thiodiazotropha endolucinida]
MRNKIKGLYELLNNELVEYSNDIRKLPGISTQVSRDVFVMQLIDSIRRVEYVIRIRNGKIDKVRTDPSSDHFDPLKAAIYQEREGNYNESVWLTFLTIHFGKSAKSEWRLARDIYGGYTGNNIWTWERISNDPASFDAWYDSVANDIMNDGIPRRFGNHRKYESLRPDVKKSLPMVFNSYVSWVGPDHNHSRLFNSTLDSIAGDRRGAFDLLYNSMRQVVSFGRTARFDYLTMVSKLGLVDIEPGKTYMSGATGPVSGAKLLLLGNTKANVTNVLLETELGRLEEHLSIGTLGMQVLEDALCNWQKSPKKYILFRG